MSRIGGFSPSQWVLGRLPRVPGSQFDAEEAFDLGVLANVAEDGSGESARHAAIRAAARNTFAEHDVGSRTARAAPRRAAPVAGPYSVGDVVCFRKRPTEGDVGAKWSTGSRIVGFDGKNAWVITEGVPVCVATDRLRPCTAAEALAYAPPEGEQQSFVDERREINEPGSASGARPETVAEVQQPERQEQAIEQMDEQHGNPIDDGTDDDLMDDDLAIVPVAAQQRTPLQRNLLDDVPHDIRAREEVMRRRVDSASEPAPEPASPLLDAWNRSGTTGAGVDVLQRRSANVSLVSFFNERMTTRGQSRKKLKSSNNIIYHRESDQVKSGLRLARQAEWGKWRNFNAAIPVGPEQLQELLT
eukprot:4123019-Pyramimonas_sp.AAC.3